MYQKNITFLILQNLQKSSSRLRITCTIKGSQLCWAERGEPAGCGSGAASWWQHCRDSLFSAPPVSDDNNNIPYCLHFKVDDVQEAIATIFLMILCV